MEQENYDELFAPQVNMGGATNKSEEEYRVGADKGKNGVYQSIIRFIPWYKNPKNSIVEKWVSWLVDPVTQRGRFVDCPSSVGKPSLLQDMYWKLKKSDSVQEQKKADIFSRRQNFVSLIQVIKDANQPELEGKILVYRFGRKLWEKINAEQKPIIGDPQNPYDLLHGKVFALVITKVSGYNNYDQSKFVDKVIPLCMPDEESKLIPINDKTDKQEVYDFLKDNSPDLDKYGYKEWDSDTYDYVNGVITAVTGQAPKTNVMSNINTATHKSNSTDESNDSDEISSKNVSVETLGDNDDSNSDFNSDIDLPDLPDLESDNGIAGDLDEALAGL